jgi:hypothetical protein
MGIHSELEQQRCVFLNTYGVEKNTFLIVQRVSLSSASSSTQLFSLPLLRWHHRC